MGMIRKTLHVATLGAVAPRSAKQEVALQTLEAVRGPRERWDAPYTAAEIAAAKAWARG
jgi:hypothetical protein